MNLRTGANQKDIKLLNRSYIIELLCTNQFLSRADLTKITGLTAMTISNIITELINADLVVELKSQSTTEPQSVGRKPVILDISPKSPVICGIFISRHKFTMAISDFKANILKSYDVTFENGIDADWLMKNLITTFHTLKHYCKKLHRDIIGTGIACAGPIDSVRGIILNPPNFHNINNLPICTIMENETHLPTFLINNSCAGALAENLYGYGVNKQNFMYVNIYEGIGSGMVIDGRLYQGQTGHSPEIGHTSINFVGDMCACGNRGCLELYANESKLVSRTNELLAQYPSDIITNEIKLNFKEILKSAAKDDRASNIALNEFCTYMSYALINTLNIHEFPAVILGYESYRGMEILESILSKKINAYLNGFGGRETEIIHSKFFSEAPLVGAVAQVLSQVFEGKIDCIGS